MGNKRSARNDSELDSTVGFSVSVVEPSGPDSSKIYLKKLKETAE
jgi:hypothetical protein